MWLVLGLIGVLLEMGCVPRRVGPVDDRRHFGPTEPMWEVVEQINANNRMIPTLWGSHRFEVEMYDSERQRMMAPVVGDGVMLYRRPMELRLTGSRPLVDFIFDLGSNPETYWMRVQPEVDTMWWGRYEHLGKPCAGEIPIRPDLVLEVLGITEFDTDFLRPPAPVMRFNNDADAYMFVWHVAGRDRWIAQKEIWYDRVTKLPTLVVLFDEHGRILLRAYLMRHEPVAVAGVAEAQWPRVATDFRLFFPETRSRMEIRLTEVALTGPRGVPRDGSFRLPSPREAGVGRVIQIDAECDD